MGMDKTLEMINRTFYWPRMAEDIEDYIRSCDVYKSVTGATVDLKRCEWGGMN